MRDITEINHFNYIEGHPLYYSLNSMHEIKPTDYYFMVVQKHTNQTHHNVVGKFPWTYINFYERIKDISG